MYGVMKSPAISCSVPFGLSVKTIYCGVFTTDVVCASIGEDEIVVFECIDSVASCNIVGEGGARKSPFGIGVSG